MGELSQSDQDEIIEPLLPPFQVGINLFNALFYLFLLAYFLSLSFLITLSSFFHTIELTSFFRIIIYLKHIKFPSIFLIYSHFSSLFISSFYYVNVFLITSFLKSITFLSCPIDTCWDAWKLSQLWRRQAKRRASCWRARREGAQAKEDENDKSESEKDG